jgi:hypothetical protein
MSGHPTYPWKEGDPLFASELNAAIANAAALSNPSSLVVGDGTGTPYLTFNGAAATEKGVFWNNAGTTRWRLTTETDENLSVFAYAADGSYAGLALRFQQSGMILSSNYKLVTDTTEASPINGTPGVSFTSRNTGPNPANGHSLSYYSSAGGNNFDVGLSLIATFDTTFIAGQVPVKQAEWMVSQSPNDTTHQWTTVMAEWNVVNRGADMGWARDRSSGGLFQITGGLLMIPEALVFGTGATGEGKHCLFGISVGRSGGTNSTGDFAKFYNNYLVEPDSTAPGGRGLYMTGNTSGIAGQYPYGPIGVEGRWRHGVDHTLAVYADTNATTMLAGQGIAWLTGTTGTPTTICRDTAGNGSPEGVVTANKGSTYRRFDGGAATCFYVKESGTGNTGWVAK